MKLLGNDFTNLKKKKKSDHIFLLTTLLNFMLATFPVAYWVILLKWEDQLDLFKKKNSTFTEEKIYCLLTFSWEHKGAYPD